MTDAHHNLVLWLSVYLRISALAAQVTDAAAAAMSGGWSTSRTARGAEGASAKRGALSIGWATSRTARGAED